MFRNPLERLRLSQNNILVEDLRISASRKLSKAEIAPISCYKKAPTLLELRKIGLKAKQTGKALDPETGEWTSDFVDLTYGLNHRIEGLPEGYILALYISRPDDLKVKKREWTIFGGQRYEVVLPPSGWVIPDMNGQMYDNTTGAPIYTVPQIESPTGTYFWRGDLGYGLVAVDRVCERFDGDDFEISMVQDPDFHHFNIGYREVWRF